MLDLLRALLAVVAFACFPFAVVGAAAGLLVLFDRLAWRGGHHR